MDGKNEVEKSAGLVPVLAVEGLRGSKDLRKDVEDVGLDDGARIFAKQADALSPARRPEQRDRVVVARERVLDARNGIVVGQDCQIPGQRQGREHLVSG